MALLSMKDFRGFHHQQSVHIAPLTILIGENSAGKSSFLAAYKFMLDFMRGETASFNQDPFQLGTYQQIAHYRGGKAGRAQEFRLGLTQNTALRRSAVEPSDVCLELLFRNVDSQASVSRIDLRVKSEIIRVIFASEKAKYEFVDENGTVISLDEPDMLPRSARSEFQRYWIYILSDLQYRTNRILADHNDDVRVKTYARVALLAELGQAMMRTFNRPVEATSAIRTKPLRTYTPGLDVRDGEGSHVPFELAKLYRAKNKDQWKKLQSSIESFGRSSEMFKDVGLKSFGKTVSDPFQIQLSSDGPKTNIVDLGYGTSQVLPILYSVSVENDHSIFLIQQPEVHLHPKAQAALGSFFVDSFVKSKKMFVIETHSDFIVDRMRQAVAIGVLKPEDVTILFFERKRLENIVTQISLSSDGTPINPPENYRAFFLDEQLKIMGFD